MNQPTGSLSDQVQDNQTRPVAGIWACDNCGRRIQVIMESDTPKKQSFVCVCGSEMRPGEEHSTPEATVAEEMAAVDKPAT
jgi:hypothetical protein